MFGGLLVKDSKGWLGDPVCYQLSVFLSKPCTFHVTSFLLVEKDLTFLPFPFVCLVGWLGLVVCFTVCLHIACILCSLGGNTFYVNTDIRQF